MIQVELGALLNMIPALQKLSDIPNASGKILYKISKIILKVNDEADAFTKAKERMIQKYSVPDENGGFKMDEHGNYLIKAELQKEFNEEFSQLIHTVVTLNVNKFQIDDFDNLNLTPQQMMPLMPFIEE